MSSSFESPPVSSAPAESEIEPAPVKIGSGAISGWSRSGAIARAVVRAFWFVLAPAALALAGVALLLPNPFQARSGAIAAFLARAWTEQPVAVFVALFLLFAWQARVWRAYLPLAQWAHEPERPSSFLSHVRFGALVLVALAMTLTVRTSVFAPYRVLSGSMLPTLRPGDWLGVNKLAYGARLPGMRYRFGAKAPRRGDVIAFETPPGMLGQPERLVKRVIGLPGDRIETREGQTFINQWPVPLCDAGMYVFLSSDQAVMGRLVVEFLEEQAYLTVYFGGSAAFDGYTVQRGEVFVLGDNRNNSSDSRAWNGGAGAGLPLRAIEGRVPYVLLAAQDSGQGWRARTFLPLWRELQLQGVDTTELQAGIDRCLSQAPQETTPPAPGPHQTAAADHAAD